MSNEAEEKLNQNTELNQENKEVIFVIIILQENFPKQNTEFESNKNDSILNSEGADGSKKTTFGFIKKKINNNNINNQNDSETQKNNDEINLSNNDINSDTKSFKSLRMNNNFKNENIKINMDGEKDDDIKSINLQQNNFNTSFTKENKKSFNFVKNKTSDSKSILGQNENTKITTVEKNENLNVKYKKNIKF